MIRLSRDEFRQLGGLLRPAGRREANLLLVPGPKCALEYLRAGGRPRLLVVDPEREDSWRPLLDGLPAGIDTSLLRQARSHELSRLADQPSPEGLVLVGPPPPMDTSRPPHLLLDGVQDPGNLGAILRSALWFGLDRVGLLAPCADPWSPRGIRASMGAVFQLASCLMVDDPSALPPGGRLVGLDAHDGTSLEEFRFLEHDVLVLGSESHGLRLPEGSLAARLRIPGAGRLESLNVGHAMAICAWERFRRGAR
jgi:TrmH family RNA methyltransferase